MIRPLTILLRCSAVAIAVGTSGCADDPEVVELNARVATPTDAPLGVEFESSSGWRIRVTDLRIALGPLRLRHEEHEEHPAASRENGPVGLVAALADLLVAPAHAHGGDGENADPEIVGELPGQWAVALADLGEAELGVFGGYRAEVNQIHCGLEPASSLVHGEAAGLEESPIFVAGTAERAGEVIAFVGELPHDQHAEDAGADAHTLVLDVDDYEVTNGATMTLLIDASAWFADADFSTLEQTDDLGRLVISADSELALAWEAAVDAGAGFEVAWEAG